MRISEIRIKHSIKDLKAYDKLALRKFDSKDAWFISDKLRSYDYEGADIVFAIRLFNGLELASGVIGQVAPHNYDWLNAKLNTVAKYHMSSYLYGQTLVTKHHSLPDYALSSSDTSRIVQIADSFESVKEYFRTILIEDKGSTISWHELHSKQREFAMTVSGKTVEITSDAVETFFKSIFPSSETKRDGKRGLYIRNLRLKESHEKVNISATKVMDEKTENKFPNYAADGGAFPINIRGIAGPIGAITISGLPNNLVDHALAYKLVVSIHPQWLKLLGEDGPFGVASVIVGSGYGLMVGLTPSDEELYNKLSPDLQRRVDQQRKQRLQLEKQADLEKANALPTNKIV